MKCWARTISVNFAMNLDALARTPAETAEAAVTAAAVATVAAVEMGGAEAMAAVAVTAAN